MSERVRWCLRVLWIAAVFAAAFVLRVYGAEPGTYPDHVLTPGVVKTTSAATVCRVGYTKDERHVTERMKRCVFERYGLGELPRSRWGEYEIDHFVSLELGGANDVKNLWPEPYAGEWGARRKDVIETGLHRRICRGEITVRAAQACIRDDWVACYLRYPPKKEKPR